MFGKLGDMAGMLKQAKEMQSRMKEMQERVAATKFDAEAGAGAVKATVNGKLELAAIKIDPEMVRSGDVEMLEDLIKAAVVAAQTKAAEGMKAEMQSLTGGMNIPGLDKMFGG
ncbi:MAG: YbaB/EbfC family nucleoid-associated protein [Phycisphaerales bacterium]|nr:YbaB/EbfC family nucleoid-associated protein [Phycisphaerales bacterium]MCB9856013.1 YbaB/EbfC family nucleoid-associated protein [Phycisphaerales bacterium]